MRPPLISPTDAGLARIQQLLNEGEAYLTPVEPEFAIGGGAR